MKLKKSIYETQKIYYIYNGHMIKTLLKRRIEDGQQRGAVIRCKAKKPLRLALHLRDGQQQWFCKERKKKDKKQIKNE